ncbi:hypothetical protein [Mycobacterium sp. 236(2023)]|uniref:hypothetical protein n=1 Tax=Mycobacterium sp. 236(2023) TaxID=3038163 RepID=UPI0024151868|nr:hypothetical protein [Mycobacterium sp. 236(2023)]MDG4665228.1 hypothetical protein [Mycobacterium sp. 236(2023)]
MSWLLVALIPGLLILATLGLERVESGLRREALSPADVDEMVEQARGQAVDAHARHVPQRALPVSRRPVTETAPLARRFVEPISSPGLPTHEYLAHLANTEFRQTRHANRV